MLRSNSFKHYRINRSIIERLELDDCIVSDTVTGSSVDPPYTKHTIRVQGVSESRKQRNKRMIEELEARCAEVDAEIATMPDRRLAKILLLKYIDGKDKPSWAYISSVFGVHPDYCRRLAKIYLDSLDEVSKEGFRSRNRRKAAGFR